MQKGDEYFYKYGNEERPMTAQKIVVPYKTASGMAQKEFTVYRTHHGPVIRKADGKWVAIALMQEPVKALTQSYSRTKARNYKAFRQTMELHTNSSNNTIFADAQGNIAYFHGNFIPKRDTRFDWTKPVDGSDPATEWKGLLRRRRIAEAVEPGERLAVTTSTTGRGPRRARAARRRPTIRRTSKRARNRRADFTRFACSRTRRTSRSTSLRSAAYDSYLPAFETMIPALLKAYDASPARTRSRRSSPTQIAVLRGWDYRWAHRRRCRRRSRCSGVRT